MNQNPLRWRTTLGVLCTAGLVVAGSVTTAVAASKPAPAPVNADAAHRPVSDNLRPAIAVKQDALKQRALQRRLDGSLSATARTAKVGKDQYVDLANEGTDRIFVILAEFGDTRHAAYPDANPDGTPASDAQKFTGPGHNEIPEPNRFYDNSTLWKADYNVAHYRNMYFTRLKAYFEHQSSGRYSVDGSVTEWVKVPFNEARYGRDVCGDIVCNNTWFLIRDSLSVWTKQQLDNGMSMAQIQAYLATFDKQDRYDVDGDGIFDEPDGFIDHFQIVHAGGDQAAGDPTYGSDAIWSHRWYAAVNTGGPGGLPGVNIGQGGVSSGVPLADNPTGVWVGDYTIQPENGGLGVFVHEYTHDLGLPDLYDTSGNTGGAENSTGFWSLMSSGANIGSGGLNGIGDAPTDLSAWELFQLGWLNAQGTKGPFYDVAYYKETSTHKLGRNTPATKNRVQALFVVLPDKEVTTHIGDPAAGAGFFYSGSGDDLNNSMSLTAGVTGGALTAKVRYDIEQDYDYAFVESSSDGGATWDPVLTNLSVDAATDQSGFNASGTGLSGISDGYDAGTYLDLTATLPNGTNALRVRYQTDGGLARPGLSIDEIAIGGTVVGSGDTADEGWAFDGFSQTTGLVQNSYFNAYVAENRQYDGYDKSLKTAYNFGFLNSRPDWVETFKYQNGMLVWYWDSSYLDNNVGDHPGHGLLLPVDAHPYLTHWPDGTLVRPRLTSFDATFGLEPTNRTTLHLNGVPLVIPSKPAVRTFDDTKTYWFNSDAHGATGSHPGRYQPGWASVDVPKTGTTIKVVSASQASNTLTVTVAPKK